MVTAIPDVKETIWMGVRRNVHSHFGMIFRFVYNSR
jgi:hypothetical protein